VPLAQIVESLYRSVPAIFASLSGAGRAPPFWIVSGHSAGGHLAAMMAITDWPVRRIHVPLAGCVPISGIFDLEPLIGTSINTALRLDSQGAALLSPSRIRAHGARMIAVVGAEETPSFIAQSENYVRHWQECGGCAELALLRKRNHYTILCDLTEEKSAIEGRILSLAHGFRAEQGR
jgi:arylformamidase